MRSAGLLLHVSSLPGPHGIGDFGPAAHEWVETLARAGLGWWQLLPLGPTGYGDSPYQCFSAFAINPNFISPDRLVVDGLLTPDDVPSAGFAAGRVEFERVIPYKAALTERAWTTFRDHGGSALQEEFAAFRATEAWLNDFALFMAIKEARGGGSWQDWPSDLRRREPATLAAAQRALEDRIGLHEFRQFLVARQWAALRDHAKRRGIRLIGDMPIFVALDSADVWANPHLFLLDAERRPTAQAGVPPDYFSLTGQLWGNPPYDWPAHREEGFAWWAERLRAALRQVDVIRLDHFRGFVAAWHVPAGDTTAERGAWVPGPGAVLFDALREELGAIPLIAEDLGVITPEVDALRLQYDLPGMRILQFAFGGAREDRFLPHRYVPRSVVYTGTHDNATAEEWQASLTSDERRFFRDYAPETGEGAAWQLIRLAWASVADLAIAPLQDLLGVGAEGRMNWPGKPSGNWRWRATTEQLRSADWVRLAGLTRVYQRNCVG